jgi:hypothetical protein
LKERDLKRRNLPPPDWSEWSHAANLSAEEAAALTMNFCPIMFRIVASESGVEFGDATEFEKRLRMLKPSCETGLATVDLATLARRFDWEDIPAELTNLATPVISEAEPKPAGESLSDNERTKLLKHIGALALLVAEHKSIYRKAPDKEGNWRPNASQVAQAVVDHIEKLPSREGSGKSSLRESIKAGIDLLTK